MQGKFTRYALEYFDWGIPPGVNAHTHCCDIFHVCCPIVLGALECRRERALTFERSGMCKNYAIADLVQSTVPVQSSPVQRLYTAGYEHASALAVFRA